MAMLRTVAGAAVALLVVMAMVLEAQAVCPSIASLIQCQNAAAQANVMPSMACCNQVKSMLGPADGPDCLCELVTSETAKNFHVTLDAAKFLPSKCQTLMGLQYKKNYNCKGTIVP